MLSVFKSLSRKLPEEIGKMPASVSCFGKQEKRCKTFLNLLIIFSIVYQEIFDSTDPLLLHRTRKTSSFRFCLDLRFSYFNKCFD